MFLARIKTFFKRLLLLAVFIAAAWFFLMRTKSVVDRDSVIARIQALQSMMDKTANRRVPQSWDAGVYIPNEAINKCLAALTGKTLVVTGVVRDTELKGQVEITVRSASVDSSEGAGLGQATLELFLPAINASINLDATFWFGIKGIISDPSDKGIQKLVPVVRICEMTPSASLGDLLVKIRGQTSRLITAPLLQQLNVQIEKTLAQGIPLPVPRELKIDYRSHQDVPAGQAVLGLEFTVPESAVAIPWKFDASIVSKQGIWVLLAEKGAVGAEREDQRLRTMTVEELNGLLGETEKKWRLAQEATKESKTEVLLWINQTFFATMTRTVAQIPAASRSVLIQSRGYSGHLYEKRWWDKILGEGGVKIDLASPDALSVVVETADPHLEWTEKQGLVVSLPVHCVAGGDVRVHVDPLIGEGPAPAQVCTASRLLLLVLRSD